MSKGRPVITEQVILDALRRGESVIRTEGRPIITPLAASTLKERGVQVISESDAGQALPVEDVEVTDLDVAGYDQGFLLDLYTTMQRIRAFEMAVGLLLQHERIVGFAHLSIGQEAVAAGACAALGRDDYLTLTHRGHGQMIARGARLDRMMAELYGKAAGYCKGKGGSVHLADFELGILGANGIVGAGIPIAAGAAMSAKMRGTQQVALTFFGDGAVNQGAFHEAVNIAGVMKLPVIFVCENNLYSVSTPASKATAARTIADRGRAYLMPSRQVDGQNVLAVYEDVRQAVDRARRGEGPSFIESLTYRYRPHYEGEPVDLRPQEEIEKWRQRDPIELLERAMLAARVVSEDRLREVFDRVCEEIAGAIRFAEESSEPAAEEALKDVLSGTVPMVVADSGNPLGRSSGGWEVPWWVRRRNSPAAS